jgi:hypothetical protein
VLLELTVRQAHSLVSHDESFTGSVRSTDCIEVTPDRLPDQRLRRRAMNIARSGHRRDQTANRGVIQ